MTEWINGGGFYLVQSTHVLSMEERKARMDALELKLQEAERYFAERKGRTA